MMKPARKQRLLLITLMVIGAGVATAFALKSFNDNLMYFFSTTDVVEGKAPTPNKTLPGGLDVNAHHGDFFECIKTRKQPHAPVEVGQTGVAGLHLANVAHFAKKRAELAHDYVTTKV